MTFSVLAKTALGMTVGYYDIKEDTIYVNGVSFKVEVAKWMQPGDKDVRAYALWERDMLMQLERILFQPNKDEFNPRLVIYNSPNCALAINEDNSLYILWEEERSYYKRKVVDNVSPNNDLDIIKRMTLPNITQIGRTAYGCFEVIV